MEKIKKKNTSSKPCKTDTNISPTLTKDIWGLDRLTNTSNVISDIPPFFQVWVLIKQERSKRGGVNVKGHRYFLSNKHFPGVYYVPGRATQSVSVSQDNSSVAHSVLSLAPVLPWFLPQNSIP